MHELPDVTLACIDTANHVLALRALTLSMRGLAFGRVQLLTDRIPTGVEVPQRIAVAEIARLASRDDYSRFVLKSLAAHIETTHVLLVQWDGYVVNANAFDEAFLDTDYIGAKWFWYDDAMRVGNGGFSLRSHRLLRALQDPRIMLDVAAANGSTLAPPGAPAANAEDFAICRTFRPLLEREYGIRFATEALADRFAFEAAYPVGLPFGFHGLYNFCRVIPPDELTVLAERFSDGIAASLQLAQLIRNCVALAQWAPAAALAKRRLAVLPTDGEARVQLERAKRGLAQGPVLGRNDPCPCGSGRRYKSCHGSLGTAGAATTGSAPPPAPPSVPPSLPPSTQARAASGAHVPGDTSPAFISRASADALAQQGLDAHRRGDVAGAERAYREALVLDPDQALALHYLGVVLYQQGRVHDALRLLERAVARVPQETEFHNNLGLVYAALDRNEDAVAAYHAAIALRPAHATAWNNLGLTLTAMNRIGEAIDAYRQALAAQPSFAHAHWNLALALLARGDYAEGWCEYEWRLRLPELGGNAPKPPAPRWFGDNLGGRTLLVTTEQGLGDAIQFVRFARTLAGRGARVVVEVGPPLARLLATAPGMARVQVVTSGTGTTVVQAFDYSIPLLSVPGVLAVGANELASDTPYLRADSTRRAEAVQAIAREVRAGSHAGAGCRRIGLAWAGSPTNANDQRRSIALAQLAPLLACPDITWYSLQKGPGEEQIAQVPEASRLVSLELRNDFDGTAALVDALDAVVTVDTSIAHLAGALGKPVSILLPFAPDWRWGITGGRTPWYPSARLFRQPATGDWASAVAELVEALCVRT